jgi:HEAT repeat protein
MRWAFLLVMSLSSCSARTDGLKSDDPGVRQEAVRNVARGDRARALRVLAEVARSDSHEDVRTVAVQALADLGPGDATGVLVEVAQSRDTVAVRSAAFSGIEKTRDPAAVPGLIAIWRLQRDRIDWGAHTAATIALARIGRPAIEPLLTVASSSDDGYVRASALDALTRIDHSSADVRQRVTLLLDDQRGEVSRAAQRYLEAHPQ